MFLKKIKRYKQLSEFNPTLLSVVINPFHLVRKGLFDEISKNASLLSGSFLDVGCGSKPYLDHFIKSTSYVGLEYESPILQEKKLNVEFTYDGKIFPFQDNSFDSVVSFQVLEHVFEPDVFINEIKRVLKPNGRLLITVPFFWDEHEQPYDYARYTSFGLKYIFEKKDFNVLYQSKTLANFAALIQLLILFIYKRTPKNKVIFYTMCLICFFPLNLIGMMCNLIKTGSDIYMDNVIVLENRK